MACNSEPYSFVFKYIIIGDAGIGKSSILQAYVRHTFDPEMISTIGIEFGTNIVDVELVQDDVLHRDSVKIQIWDTAGQERFQAVTGAYYRGSIGVFIVYDITSIASFNHMKMWYNRFLDRNDNDDTTQFIIVGNKADKDDKREVTYAEGKELADSLNAGFFETSCRNMTNIAPLMNEMTRKVYSVAIKARENRTKVDGIRESRSRSFKGTDTDQMSLLGTPKSGRKKCCK